MALKEREQDIQNAILEYLKVRGHYALRINSGARPVESGSKRYFIRMAPKGTHDIIGCIKDTGQFFSIEVKSKIGKLSVEQKDTMDRIRQLGGISFMARSIDDVQAEGL